MNVAVDLVRLPDKGLTQTQKMQSRLEVKGSDLLSVLDAINTLSACAWKINQPVSVAAHMTLPPLAQCHGHGSVCVCICCKHRSTTTKIQLPIRLFL